MIQTNALAVDVEIIFVPDEMSYFHFHPNNPFVRRNCYHPLPYSNVNSKFENFSLNDRALYWVVEEELTITPPSLDLKKAFNCFNQVPSAGAHYALKLCVDVPNNNHPLELPPFSGSETGHSFVVVTKTNGRNSVTQVFGFYAVRHPGYFFWFRSLDSTIKNNQLREINASIEMELTDKQFELLRKNAFELAKRKYAALDCNCTNYSLDLWNSVRQKPLIIDSYTVYLPNNCNNYTYNDANKMTIDKTPQMLFKKLKEMKNKKDTEASHILIDQSNKTKAPLSHGECN